MIFNFFYFFFKILPELTALILVLICLIWCPCGATSVI